MKTGESCSHGRVIYNNCLLEEARSARKDALRFAATLIEEIANKVPRLDPYEAQRELVALVMELRGHE